MNSSNNAFEDRPDVFNTKLLQAFIDAEDGQLKTASEASSDMIRKRLRENSFLDLILPPKPVSDGELTYLPDTELPVIVEEMEPDSPGAKTIPFNSSADTAFYTGSKFVVYFSKITTPEFTKNIDELRTYKNDLRKVVTDNSLKDIHTEKDGRFIKTIDRQVGAVGGIGAAGVAQNFEISGLPITRDSYVDLISYLEDRELNNGVWLVNRKTALASAKWDRTEFGGDMAQSIALEGLKAIKNFVLFGIPHIATMKSDLVPDQVIYQFTEPNFLGRHYVLQDATMYVEKKKDILRFSAQMKLGVTIANVASVNRIKFI